MRNDASPSARARIRHTVVAAVLSVLLPSASALAADEWTLLDQQASTQYREGKHDAALETARQALTVAQRDPDSTPGATRIASSLNALALIEQARGHHDEARRQLQRAITIASRALPADHPNLAALHANLTALDDEQRQHDIAHHARRAQDLNEQALALHERGDYAQAEQRYRQALPLVEAHFGPRSAQTARVLVSLADTHAARRQYPQAESLYEHALAIYASHEDETVAQADTLNALAATLYLQRQFGKAEPLFRQALALLETAIGPSHTGLLPVLDNLYALHRSAKRDGVADTYRRRADAIRRQTPSPQAPAGAAR